MKYLLLAAALATPLTLAACNPAKPSAEEAAKAAAAADPAAAKKAELKAEQDRQKAEFDAAAGDEAKIDDLADKKNGFALLQRGQTRLKSDQGFMQQGGFDDMEAAAAAGNAEAQIWVGQHMAYGLDGYPLKPNSGLQMLIKAAEQDNVEAILAVGKMYEQDTFMQDQAKAKTWYEKGAALGSDQAKAALGNLGANQDFSQPVVPEEHSEH
jgi:TPR repeat protein